MYILHLLDFFNGLKPDLLRKTLQPTEGVSSTLKDTMQQQRIETCGFEKIYARALVRANDILANFFNDVRMKILSRAFQILFSLFFTTVSHASLVEPGDGPYSSLNRGRILYVYDRNDRDLVPQVEAYIETIHRNYEKSFNWHLDEQQDLVLTSPNNQIANAFATVSPNILSLWYPSGVGGMGGNAALESEATNSWYIDLALHETSHLYQLNSKTPFSRGLKYVLGNSSAFIIGFVPFFVHPNQLLPTFLVEGNAVFNESRANVGGRLHSGEMRALVLAQIHDGEIDPNRLINREFRYPYGANPYYQGGYFQAHLAGKYGVDKTNSFFLAQSEHFIDPFILNKTFRDHFGSSYPQEMREYVREWLPLANKQVFYPSGRAFIDSPYVGAMNHDAKSIFFVISDGIEMPELVHIDKASGDVQYKRIDLPIGKVFYPNGIPETSTSVQHDLHRTEFSLYGEDHAFDERYRGQVVNDQRAGKTASLSSVHSQLASQILLDGEAYDLADSQPILDETGNIYYFRQNGAERILFKNRQPVFKIDGFYGKLTEVGADGAIYFMGNTDFGSTLYRFKNGEITRALESDRVVDARLMNGDEAIAEEVAPEGHRIFRERLIAKAARPVLYAYPFPSYNLVPQVPETVDQVEKEEHHYNSLRQMRYSSLDLFSGYSSYNGLTGSATLNFTDPLEYQNVSATVLGSTIRSFATEATYTYTRFLPQLYATYLFDKHGFETDGAGDGTAYDQQALVGFYLPVLTWRHYTASVGLAGMYSNLDHRAQSYYPPDYKFNKDETIGTSTDVSLQFVETPDPMLSFFPWRSWSLHYRNQLESPTDIIEKRYNSNIFTGQFEQGFKHEIYASVTGNVAWAENHDIIADNNIIPLTTDVRVSRLSGSKSFLLKNAETLRFEVNKVLNTQLYSPRIPLGLDRLAPFVTVQESLYDNDGSQFGDYPTNLFEFGYGVDLQLLLAHIAQFKFRIMAGYNTAKGNGQDLSATLNGGFKF